MHLGAAALNTHCSAAAYALDTLNDGRRKAPIGVSSSFLADRANGRAYSTVLHPSSLSESSVCLSVASCIVAKRCVLEQKLLLTAYRKSYRLVPK